MIRIDELDPSDLTGLREFWEVERESVRHDREHAILRTWPRLRTMMEQPNAYYARTLLVARDTDGVVGCAEVGGSLQDNTHLADLEIHVLPGHRRRGVGRALHDAAARRCRDTGRSSICGEVYVPAGSEGPGEPAYEFAASLGFGSVHTEDHLLLTLPMPADEVARLHAKADGPAYDVVTWTGACPEEYLADYCAMQTRMSVDLPTGAVDVEPVVVDAARVRAGEKRTLRSFDAITAVVRRRSDQVFAGYSQLFLPHGTDYALQDDTLVMPEHRGSRLGTGLKLATLGVLAGAFPDRVGVHTWTAVGNQAMQATNRDFGFVPVERMHEMQRRDG